MAYKLYDDPKDRMREALHPFRKKYHRDFYALKDINLQVKRGEGLGIIGRNGSGKSTLLKIVCGVLQPTTGSVHVNGKLAALLELGAGFNPEFTGRENVYLNGAVLGFSRREIHDRFDEIASFADIGAFIDQPVKTYSSGMYVRLAFSVQFFAAPDVLVVDEALAVGDVFFQQKCFKRIRDILDAGTTLLLVSHDIAAVQNLCQRAMLLDKGKAVFEGPPEEAASQYHASSSAKPAAQRQVDSNKEKAEPHAVEQVETLKADIISHNILASAKSRHGARDIELVAASFVNELGQHSMSVETLKSATIHLLLKAHKPILDPSTGIHLFDRMNNLVFAAGTRQLGVHMKPMESGEERIIKFEIEFAVQPGRYTFSLGCGEPSADGPNAGFVQDRHEGLGPIQVHSDSSRTLPFYGIAQGSDLIFDITITNDTEGAGFIKFATSLSKPSTGQHTGILLGPADIFLGASQSKSGSMRHPIGNTFPVGSYRYHGYIYKYGKIYDECAFDFQVTDSTSGGCSACHGY